MVERSRVNAAHCEYDSKANDVYDALVRATSPLVDAWTKLHRAKTIIIKFNQDYPLDKVVHFEGQRQDLVCDKIVRATLRLLRENTDAEIKCADVSFYRLYPDGLARDTFAVREALSDFGVEYIDGITAPTRDIELENSGLMFNHYAMISDLVEPGVEVVSVAKAKSHGFTGFTGCLKNLFGLIPSKPDGRPRTYYHHLIRLPYMLVDIGRVLNPALNIVDGLIGQTGSEWKSGHEKPIKMNTIVAGENAVSTDAAMLHLMGLDPSADWDDPPFHSDRNMIRIGSESGFGSSDVEEIDFESEVEIQPPGTFAAHPIYKRQENRTLRKTMCEQALYYANNIGKFEKFSGQYILLQDYEVKMNSVTGKLDASRRELAKESPDHGMWLKFVDIKENEGENYEVYRKTLEHFATREIDMEEQNERSR